MRPDGRIAWPWRRQPGESRQAFAAFEVYRDGAIRGVRSIRRTAEELGKSRQLLERWSVRWRWVERCDKYDLAEGRLRVAQEVAEISVRARLEVLAEEAARSLALHEDFRAAALMLPLPDLAELLGQEAWLGGMGPAPTPNRGNAPDPRLGRTTRTRGGSR